jgi:hypothetical protein
MKAIIKILTANKEFSKEDMDSFRRILNVLHEHHLSASLEIKKKEFQTFTVIESKLIVV